MATRLSAFFLQPVSVRSFATDLADAAKAWAAIAFLLRPVSVRSFARDLAVITKALATITLIAAAAAHLPALLFAGLGIWALSNGRFFSVGFAFICAFTYTQWLWSFIPA
jgi:hypothetical protein